jgi:hypothetical protein
MPKARAPPFWVSLSASAIIYMIELSGMKIFAMEHFGDKSLGTARRGLFSRPRFGAPGSGRSVQERFAVAPFPEN